MNTSEGLSFDDCYNRIETQVRSDMEREYAKPGWWDKALEDNLWCGRWSLGVALAAYTRGDTRVMEAYLSRAAILIQEEAIKNETERLVLKLIQT